MSEEKKSTAGWGTVVAVVTVITLMGVIFFWLKGCELYIGGVIFRDVRALAGMTFEIIMFIWIILASALSFKKIKDEKERKKMRGSIIAVSIVMLAMLGFMAWIVAGDVERSGKAAIAETDIGEGQSLLLAENEEKFSTSGESFYEITVYCRKGIRLKKIGRQDDSSMVVMGSLPQIVRSSFTKAAARPKRVSVSKAFSERMGVIS